MPDAAAKYLLVYMNLFIHQENRQQQKETNLIK